MARVHIDIESFSKTDIRKVGAYRYAEDESTEVLCICWAVNDGPVELWHPAMGQVPLQLILYFQDPSTQLCAHNANFERTMLNQNPGQCLGLPWTAVERWYCTAAKAAMHSLPRDLERCSMALDTRKKDKAGKAVMMKLARPRKPSKHNPAERWFPWTAPTDFQTLYDYCKTDVLAEREIDKALPELPRSEREVFLMDQVINDRGVPVDMASVRLILNAWKKYKGELIDEARRLAGCSPTQVADYRAKLRTLGCELPDLTKDTVAKALDWDKLDDRARRLLEIRAEIGKTSIQKFEAMTRAVCIDGRVRGMFMYHGAGTGRWTGRLVQLHNLPRNTAKEPDELLKQIRTTAQVTGDQAQSLVRPMFIAPRQEQLLVGDFTGIEFRLSTGLTGQVKQLHRASMGFDVYVDMAGKIFKCKANEVDAGRRFVGKQAILGLGYGMGKDKFHALCAEKGQPISLELATDAVDVYREEYSHLVAAWKACEHAALEAVRNPGRKVKVLKGQVTYVVRGRFLYCVLPSKRPIAYAYPRIKLKETPWGAMRPTLYYMGVDPYSGQWCEQDTYGGKEFENIVQGLASDMLRYAMQQCEKETIPVVLHVHDEIAAEAYAVTVEQFTEIMQRKPDWAKGIPIDVKAFSTTRYRKD